MTVAKVKSVWDNGICYLSLIHMYFSYCINIIYIYIYVTFIKICFIKILVCKTNRHESHTFLSSVNIKCEILAALYSYCGRLMTCDILCAVSQARHMGLYTWFLAIGPMKEQPYMSLANESWGHILKNITYYTSSYWC